MTGGFAEIRLPAIAARRGGRFRLDRRPRPGGALIHFLVYVSSAVEPFGKAELQALLKKTRANNTRDGITGMLLYRDGNFMQILEGEEATVRATFARIARDPRHRGMIVLLRGHEEGRQFADWSMGFRDLDSDSARTVPGYSEFLNTPLTSEEFSADLTRCRRLLLSFKKSSGARDGLSP